MEELRIYGNDLAKVQVHWYSVIYFASQLYLQRYTFYSGTPRNCSFFFVFNVISWPVHYCSSVKVSFHVGKALAERKSAYPHQTEGLTMDVRILFLTAQPPLPLAPFVHWWKRNWDRYSQPLAAHEWATKGCPYRRSRRRMSVCVCPNKSDRHIRTFFFCGASACSRFQASLQVRGRFLFSCSFRILELFHSICLLLRLPPFCDFQTAHQVVILV